MDDFSYGTAVVFFVLGMIAAFVLVGWACSNDGDSIPAYKGDPR
jgi:hypothetical protein